MEQVAFHNAKNNRLDILDKRYYHRKGDDKWFPSLTHVIKAGAPTSPELIKWFKQMGMNADLELKKAGEFGSILHDMIDKHIKGERIALFDNNGKANYTEEQWRCFLKYKEFMDTYNPEILANEVIIISDFFQVGQTLDLVCKINNERWLIDFKTSNYIHNDHFIQIVVNQYSWDEFFPEYKIDRIGLLHLKAETRGPDSKKKKLQGKGWQVVEADKKDWAAYKTKFQLRHNLWLDENPNWKPINYSIDTVVDGYKHTNPNAITGEVTKSEGEIAA